MDGVAVKYLEKTISKIFSILCEILIAKIKYGTSRSYNNMPFTVVSVPMEELCKRSALLSKSSFYLYSLFTKTICCVIGFICCIMLLKMRKISGGNCKSVGATNSSETSTIAGTAMAD
uniref:PIR Superfamily Protein n=1 Tax=Heterorhabditis bacteriophora TaxID=37862 RepID=A0A1I7X479_HETBA